MSDKPAGEWTEKRVMKYFGIIVSPNEAWKLAQDINAALRNAQPFLDNALKQLAAERGRAENWKHNAERYQRFQDWAEHLRIQLAAEVEKVNKMQEQLAAEQETSDDLREQLAGAVNEHHKVCQQQLAAEQEKVVTLVELLEQVLQETVNTPVYPDGPCLNKETRDDIKAALAKVKEVQ